MPLMPERWRLALVAEHISVLFPIGSEADSDIICRCYLAIPGAPKNLVIRLKQKIIYTLNVD